MLPFIRSALKTKVGSQSSEHGIVATHKHLPYRSGSCGIERHVRFLSAPESMEQNSQLASNGNDSLIPGLACHLWLRDEVPTVEAAESLPCGRREGVLNTRSADFGDRRPPRVGDAELRIMPSAGLVSQLAEDPDNVAHIATALESFLAAESQHESQNGQMADTMDLQQRLGLRILRLAELLDLAIVLLDLQSHLYDLLKRRAKRLP